MLERPAVAEEDVLVDQEVQVGGGEQTLMDALLDTALQDPVDPALGGLDLLALARRQVGGGAVGEQRRVAVLVDQAEIGAERRLQAGKGMAGPIEEGRDLAGVDLEDEAQR